MKFVLIGLILAIFQTIYGTIKIYSPPKLLLSFKDREIKYGLANFGNVPYGTTLAGRVFYYPDFKTGCHQFTSAILDPEGDPDKDFSPIVLVERGKCSFVRKSRNIQALGGSLALIMDNQENSNPEEIIMSDDGSGSSITIPTIIISKEDGELIRNEVIQTESDNKIPGRPKEFTVLVVEFIMDKPDDRVEYDIWYTSGHAKMISFLKGMRVYNDRLGKHALMTPHMFVRKCPWCTLSDLENNCILFKENIYCPQYGVKTNMSGTGTLNMGVIELCVYKHLLNESTPGKWWDFMEKVYENPVADLGIFANKVMQDLGINVREVNKCMDQRDKMLEEEESLLKKYEIKYNPAIVINERVYRGNMNPDSVFKSICAGFNVTPDVCFDDYDMGTMERKHPEGSIGASTIIGLILAVIIINIVIVYCYRKNTRMAIKEEMQMQINSVMSQYMALRENQPKA